MVFQFHSSPHFEVAAQQGTDWANLGLTCLATLIGSLIGGLATWYAMRKQLDYLQDEAGIQRRIALFDKRVAIYEEIHRLCNNMGNPDETRNAMNEFRRAVRHAKYLFRGQAIAAHIDGLWRNAVSIEYWTRIVMRGNTQTDYLMACAKEAELLNWFLDQRKETEKLFVLLKNNCFDLIERSEVAPSAE